MKNKMKSKSAPTRAPYYINEQAGSGANPKLRASRRSRCRFPTFENLDLEQQLTFSLTSSVFQPRC